MLFGAAPPRPPSAPSLGHLREIIRPLTPHVFYNRMCTALAEQERAKEALKEQSNEAGTFPTLSKKSRGKRETGEERSESWQQATGALQRLVVCIFAHARYQPCETSTNIYTPYFV